MSEEPLMGLLPPASLQSPPGSGAKRKKKTFFCSFFSVARAASSFNQKKIFWNKKEAAAQSTYGLGDETRNDSQKEKSHYSSENKIKKNFVDGG